MTKGYWLGSLQMREARHNSVSIAFRQIQQALLQTTDFRENKIDLVTHVEANISRHLIITRTARMQFLTRDTDLFSQRRFDIHVYIFKRNRPLKFTTLDLDADLTKATNDCVALLLGQHTHFSEHVRVSNRALYILTVETLIKVH